MIPCPPLTTMTPLHYGAILADPPWKYVVRSPKGDGRSASRHYPVMTLDEIKALPVRTRAAKNAWLFLWVPGPHLRLGFQVLDAWDFTYSSIGFIWVKTNKRAPTMFYDRRSFFMGMGHTTRKNAELCLLARRGAPKRLSKSVRELIISPLREHSRKPEEFYDRVRAFTGGPYLELFAREVRPAFDCWGNEVHKFGSAT